MNVLIRPMDGHNTDNTLKGELNRYEQHTMNNIPCIPRGEYEKGILNFGCIPHGRCSPLQHKLQVKFMKGTFSAGKVLERFCKGHIAHSTD